MQPPVGSSIFDSFFHFQEFLISQEISEYLDMFWLTCYKIRLIEFKFCSYPWVIFHISDIIQWQRTWVNFENKKVNLMLLANFFLILYRLFSGHG